MDEVTIEKVEELANQVVGTNKKVLQAKVSRLTAPGENNLSLVLRVDFVIKNEEDGSREELHAVAKVMPTLEFMRFAFESNFRNEVAFYNIIVPTLQDFQKEQGVYPVIDLFPRLYIARSNLHGKSNRVDEDAVLLMDNLVVAGYQNLDRMIGFDLETTKLVLKDLALFHAVPLALKRLNPQLFEKRISPHFAEFTPPPSQNGDNKPYNPGKRVVDIFEESEEFIEFLPELRRNLAGFEVFSNEPHGLFSSICHGDLWVNNILIKFKNGKPMKNKFVDYQIYTHNSIAKDVFFLLWTSVQQQVLKESLDDLIKYYYDNFIENLERLKCDATQFTFEKFLKEITRVSKVEFGHAMIMNFLVVFAKRGGIVDEEGNPNNPLLITKDDVTPQAMKSAFYMVKECKKRGWLA